MKNKNLISLLVVLCMLVSYCITPISAVVAGPFTDVDDTNPVKDYIVSLAEKGIIKGYGNDIFAPDDVCTRGQLVTLLWRASGEPAPQKDADITDISEDDYFKNAVLWAYENHISKIYSDGSFGADLPVDREHFARYMHNWSKYMKNTDTMKVASLDNYNDFKIYNDSRFAFGWAVEHGLITPDEENRYLYPKKTITRAEAAYGIEKLLSTHYCLWSSWTDNGDGTCQRECTLDEAHIEKAEHKWNDGELTVAVTATSDGEITYTCSNCLATKKESVSKGTEIITRGDLEDAIVNTAFAYYSKGSYMQYDSTQLADLTSYRGGLTRLTVKSAPEAATSDSTFYTVCSNYVDQCYNEALNINPYGEMSEPLGLDTYYLIGACENQTTYPYDGARINHPITEDDVDACLIRWMDWEYLMEKLPDRVSYQGFGVFESSAYYDFADAGITIIDDGYEGSMHYSYYDADGNIISPDEIKSKYIIPICTGEGNILRPGDIIVTTGHATLYVGNGKILDSTNSGSSKGEGKINTTTGEDRIEAGGTIRNLRTPESFLNTRNMFAITRPLEFVVKMGYDEYPENDVVKNLTIPESTISRIKYPALNIDRTVDITPYGTAVKDDYLTYSVKITNKSDDDFYKKWISGYDASKPTSSIYEDLVVTEMVPEGTELVADSISNGGKLENGKIVWTLSEVKPGESFELTYKVKVTAEVGSVIVNDGGWVDNIPSNIIKNVVGNTKLDDKEISILNDISAGGADALKEFGTGTDFAEAIYSKMEKELELPALEDITNELFTLTSVIPGDAGVRGKDLAPINMFERQKEVSPSYEGIQKMLVDRFWGGRRYFAGDDEKWNFADNCIKEMRTEYLEAGDIIICAQTKDRGKTTMTNEFGTVSVMVYSGSDLICQTLSPDGITGEIIKASEIVSYLNKMYAKDKDIFFALRPSQFISFN